MGDFHRQYQGRNVGSLDDLGQKWVWQELRIVIRNELCDISMYSWLNILRAFISLLAKRVTFAHVTENGKRNGVADLSKLKELAVAKLKQGSQLRDLILSEPDYLPREEARIKARFFAKLLYAELAN